MQRVTRKVPNARHKILIRFVEFDLSQGASAKFFQDASDTSDVSDDDRENQDPIFECKVPAGPSKQQKNVFTVEGKSHDQADHVQK
jgi:hypothetical protein